MSSWKGKYLTGTEGSAFCLGLLHKQDAISIKRVNEYLSSNFSEYSPWMSHINELDVMKELDSLKKENDFILSSESLEKLNQVLSIEGHNLKRIHHDSNGKIGVCLKNQLNYSKDTNKLNECLVTLKDNNPEFYIRLKNYVSHIVLQTSSNDDYELRTDGTGLSSFNYRKGIFLSIPLSKYWEVEFFLNLWHEVGHQGMITLQLVDKIINESHFKKIFSVIRKSERPAILSLHAVIACAFMVDFLVENKKWLISLSSEEHIKNKIKENRDRLMDGIDKLSKVKFTDLGEGVLKECMALYIFSGDFL